MGIYVSTAARQFLMHKHFSALDRKTEKSHSGTGPKLVRVLQMSLTLVARHDQKINKQKNKPPADTQQQQQKRY